MVKHSEMSLKMFQRVVGRILGQMGHKKIFSKKMKIFEPVEARSEPRNGNSEVAPKHSFLSESPQNRSK